MARKAPTVKRDMTSEFLSPARENDSPSEVTLQGLWAAAGDGLHDASIEVHVHSKVEVGIVLSGEEEIHYGSRVSVCGPGDVWLCGLWEPHGWRIADPGTRNIVIKFPPSFLGHALLGSVPWLLPFSLRPADRPRIDSEHARARILQVAGMMGWEIEEKRPGWEGVVRLHLLLVLTELIRDWQHPPGTTPSVNVDDLAAVMPAMALVHAVPWRRIGLEQAAAACGMSVSTFRLQFVRVVGFSFREFCLRARLSVAAYGLLNSDKTIGAIAREVGFVDDSHFRRHFRRHYSLGPAEYRREPFSHWSHALDSRTPTIVPDFGLTSSRLPSVRRGSRKTD